MADSPYDLSTGRKGFRAWSDIKSDAARYREGYAAGRAEVLALVRKLPSPIKHLYPDWNRCEWCGADIPKGALTLGEMHPANGCLFVLAQETGKEQA